MNRFRRPRGLTIWPMLLALLWGAGCARPAGLQDEGSAHADQHQLPFHDEEVTPVARPDAAPAVPDNPEAGLPFHHSQTFRNSQNLPAGTLLTVRLKHPISAENPAANATFEALVDEAVVVEGNRLVPRGAVVAGRVESARASDVRRNGGYVRLALDSLHLAGGNLPIRTSSLFVRGNAGGNPLPQGETPPRDPTATVVSIEKGRRLTFRLTESAYVAASQRTPVSR
jgi:hypothetical protein